MPEEFLLIPGRSSKQGVSLNEGKYTDGYKEEISTLRMDPDDMQRMHLENGDLVRMWNDVGEVVVPCVASPGELQPSMVFICYGDASSRLMGGETHGSGMPDSKALDVFLEKHSDTPAEESVNEESVATESVVHESDSANEEIVEQVEPEQEQASEPEAAPQPTEPESQTPTVNSPVTQTVEPAADSGSTPAGQIAVVIVVLIVAMVWAMNFLM